MRRKSTASRSTRSSVAREKTTDEYRSDFCAFHRICSPISFDSHPDSSAGNNLRTDSERDRCTLGISELCGTELSDSRSNIFHAFRRRGAAHSIGNSGWLWPCWCLLCLRRADDWIASTRQRPFSRDASQAYHHRQHRSRRRA